MNVIIANKYKEMLMNLQIEVIKSIEGVYDVQEIVDNFSNFYYDRMILDVTAIQDYQNPDTLQKLSIGLDMNKIILLLDDSEQSTDRSYLSKLISMGIYNFTKNSEGIMYLLSNPNSYRDVAHIHNVNAFEGSGSVEGGEVVSQRIIGIKSLTEGAGASSLTYMMKKALEKDYRTCMIEVDKRDLTYFSDKDTFETTGVDLAKELMKKRDYNVVLIDLNAFNDPDVCNEVLYLVEPTKIKLNKLLMKNRNVFLDNRNKKIVLVKSFLTDSDIKEFEYETNSKVYYNLPAIDERKASDSEVIGLLAKLGFTKVVPNNTEEKNKMFGMIKKELIKGMINWNHLYFNKNLCIYQAKIAYCLL